MHYSQSILLFGFSPLLTLVSAAAIAQPASIERRSIQLGWSLQASTCPSGATSCGSGACCPSSLFCIAHANDEAEACCTSSKSHCSLWCSILHVDLFIDSACRGSIEGHPVCADSSWSLWRGFQGNGFCCQVGLTGVYNSGSTVAGTCVSGAVPAGYTAASIVSPFAVPLYKKLRCLLRRRLEPAAQSLLLRPHPWPQQLQPPL
jgi:glucan endo-1,3-alpha-glucosidase